VPDLRSSSSDRLAASGRWLVLGASSAMAQAVVRRVASAGGEVVLVARDPEKLRHVADDARVRGANVVGVVQADLDVVEGHAPLLDRAFAALGRVDVVLIAQGVLAEPGACERDPALAERVLVTNMVGAALLAQGAALRLAAQGSGTLVGISSVAGDRVRGSNYQYGAAKAGFSAFLEGLRCRMSGRGIRVVTVKPGFVDSPMTAHLPKGPLWASPDAVAGTILRAAARGREVVYAPGYWRLVMLAVRSLPRRVIVKLRL
jgi:short-subunit dehydrogenase